MAHTGPGHVVILVENLPARRDPRVWRECRALADAGIAVTAISPARAGDAPDPEGTLVDGVRLVTYLPPPPGDGVAGYAREYALSLVRMARALRRVARRHPVDAIQACNPPDLLFLVALPYRLRGSAFVFDHHDLAPETYVERFGRNDRIVALALRVAERCSFRAADAVISTNESYRRVAIERGRCDEDAVIVVRNGPDDAQLATREPVPLLRRGAQHLCVWFGTMGPQDGVDIALRALRYLVYEADRHDCRFVFVGEGDARQAMQALALELGVAAYAEFPGWLEWDEVHAYLATAAVGLCPDPKGPLNDVSTMNKTMDYMAAGVPVVAFDLAETRVSAGDAAVYAKPNEPDAFARAISDVLDDPLQRRHMARIGRERVASELAWRHQRERYVDLYRRLLRRGTDAGERPNAPRPLRRQRGVSLAAKRVVDVTLAAVLLVVTAPLLAVAAIAVKLDSRGPVFHRGIRVGRDGREFRIYKLRSMVADADDRCHREFVVRSLAAAAAAGTGGDTGAVACTATDGAATYKVDADPRITRVGRWLRRTSIDELPQLVNVLRGEMSLVGPRPEVPYVLDAYQPWHRERFSVLPGMTGLWQVSGRSCLSPSEMLALDVHYARTWSFAGDLALLARTIPAVLGGRGVEG